MAEAKHDESTSQFRCGRLLRDVSLFSTSVGSIYAGASEPACQRAYPAAHVRNAVSIQLSAQKEVYRVGEPISLRVDIANREQQPVSIWVFAPFEATTLAMADQDGTPINQSGVAAFGYHSLITHTILPGDRYTLLWRQAGKTLEYNPIEDWGYSSSLEPGTYTIVARPFRCCAGFVGNQDQFRIDPAAVSNAVRIRVIP